MALRFCHPLRLSSSVRQLTTKPPLRNLKCSADLRTVQSLEAQKLVMEVKEKLEAEHPYLPVGRNGRDDEEMILWFLKDRKFSVEEALTKLTKAIKWRQDFAVSRLSEESLKSIYGTGKAYVHDFLDINGRPVLVVVASKHFPSTQDTSENEKLCVYLVEKALRKLPDGVEEILVVLDLRGFGTKNADISYLTFLEGSKVISLFSIYHLVFQIDVFYNYYPKRLGQLLFVEAPFVFKPIWKLFKPLMRSYASLVRFCTVETLRKEYFAEERLPADFKV